MRNSGAGCNLIGRERGLAPGTVNPEPTQFQSKGASHETIKDTVRLTRYLLTSRATGAFGRFYFQPAILRLQKEINHGNHDNRATFNP